MAAVVATPKEWISARTSLLQQEKDLTRAIDALKEKRRAMPIYPLSKSYQFTDSSGTTVPMSSLFNGYRQLIIYHFMFSPDWEAGCTSCSFCADNFPSDLSHLRSRDTEFVLVSRAPIDKINAFKKRMGWDHLTWYSSYGEDFNYDFHVTQDEGVAPVFYNFADKETLEKKGQSHATKGEQPGLSCFLLGQSSEPGQKEGQVYHTYSVYARGLETMLTTYSLLDLTPLGRQDGDGMGGVTRFKHHDKYDAEKRGAQYKS